MQVIWQFSIPGYTHVASNNHGIFCLQSPIDTDLYCVAMSRYRYADGITPAVSTAVLELPDHLTSSIITSIEVNHTMAFIGTTEAQLLKVTQPFSS